MPTPEEIKKMSILFALEKSEGDAYDPFEDEYAAEVLEWLSEHYRIVPKRKIAEWQGIVEDALKADPYITEPAWRFMWESLFGTALFNEEKK